MCTVLMRLSILMNSILRMINFLVKGWAREVTEIMKSAKICLAPLRFGAGLKGKFIDAMKNGTPSITTTIGAEGLAGDFPFSGIVSDDIEL